MAANDYYGGPPPIYPPVDLKNQQAQFAQQYTGAPLTPGTPGYYAGVPPPTPATPYGANGQVMPYGYGQPGYPPQPGVPSQGPDGPQDRGLGSTLVGGIGGAALAHKMGGGALGTMAGAVGGAILANVASHKIKDKKKKKKKSKSSHKKHHHKKRGSGSSSDSSSSSDSDSSGSSKNKKRYALGYSTGGGSAFGRRRRRKSSSSSD